jgi:hypothetical protein
MGMPAGAQILAHQEPPHHAALVGVDDFDAQQFCQRLAAFMFAHVFPFLADGRILTPMTTRTDTLRTAP